MAEIASDPEGLAMTDPSPHPLPRRGKYGLDALRPSTSIRAAIAFAADTVAHEETLPVAQE